MRILVTTGDFKNYIVPNFYSLLSELEKNVDLVIWHEPGNINDILAKINKPIDFIFINEYGETNSPSNFGNRLHKNTLCNTSLRSSLPKRV